MTPPEIVAIVLTFNEQLHIARCIERLRPLATRIVVVDSFSTDATVEIARAAGAEILQHPFSSHAEQFQWGVDAADIGSGWVLRIDCDEYLEPELIEEIRARLPKLPAEVGAVEMRRKVFFQGKWIRWGGYYDTVLTRLWRVGAARIEQRLMDEQVIVEQGSTVRFSRGDLVDDNLNDITWWTEKHNRYTTLQMVEFLNLEYPLFAARETNEGGLNRYAKFKRFLRNRIYGRFPLYVRPSLYFLQRYFLRLGILDGKKGFIFHTLQGFWNLLLIDVKIGEGRRFIRAHGVEAFRQHLRTRHRIALPEPARVGADKPDALS